MSGWLSMIVGQRPGAGDFDPETTVVKLTDRLENATLLEDRRTSLLSLKGLARDFKKLLCKISIGALAKCLRNDHGDMDIAKAVLETLVILMTTNERKPDEISISIESSQSFLSNPEHVTVLLQLLDESDFHLRYDTLALLSALHQNHSDLVVQSIMGSLNGVSKIVELLLESRDAIRTEAMLFLVALTKDNPDLQKIVAFESAFEKIFDIISAEHIEPISVHDGLQLVLNLLKQNQSNQNLFRESGCIPRLVSCMDNCLPAQEDPSDPMAPGWQPQQIKNCELALDILKTLVSTSSVNPKLAQTACYHAKAMALLLELGLAPYVPVPLQTRALSTLGDVIRGHNTNQSLLNESLIYVPLGESQVTQSALSVTIKIAVLGSEYDLVLRKAALYVVQSFLYNNPDGKLSIAMSAMRPPPDEINSELPGQHPFSNSTMLFPLLDWQIKDEYCTWFAANILSHAIYRSQRCQEVMAGMYLQQTRRNEVEDEDCATLIQSIAHTLLFLSRSIRSIRSQVAIYSVLCSWLWESPKYVAEILADGSLIQFFVEQVSASSCDPLVQGLAGFLLATIYMYDDSPDRASSTRPVYSVIKDRVGIENFESKLNRFRDDKRFLDFGNSTFFDELMIIHVTEHFNQMLREMYISPEDRSKKINEHEMRLGRVSELEAKVKELQEQLDQQASSFAMQRDSMQSTIREYEQQLYVSRMGFQALENEQQDLLLNLAEQDNEIKRLRNLLGSFDSKEPMMTTPPLVTPSVAHASQSPNNTEPLFSNFLVDEPKKRSMPNSNPTGIVDI